MTNDFIVKMNDKWFYCKNKCKVILLQKWMTSDLIQEMNKWFYGKNEWKVILLKKWDINIDR